MSLFALCSLVGLLLVVGAALRLRGRAYATFLFVVLGLFTLISVAQYPRLAPVGPLREYLQAASFLSYLMLIWPRMRPLWYRGLISIPAAFHVSATLLAFPWALSGAVGFELPWPWLPYAFTLLGLLQSLYTRESEVAVVIDGSDAGELDRFDSPPAPEGRPLRVLQITDPHLGPFMSTERLRRICERAVARDPDLIAITGDLLTMESRANPEALTEALSPLREMQGRVFACMGNHDHEAPELVATALANNAIELLNDEARVCDTPVGAVEVLGLDHRWRGRKREIAEVCGRFPRTEGVLRLVLLHDPSAFVHVPETQADLVLSGHTHGGHVGFVSFGLPWTFVSMINAMPDHGLWARGRARLYVHRGTGHYGFPLRVGVPAEQSVLHIHVARASGSRLDLGEARKSLFPQSELAS